MVHHSLWPRRGGLLRTRPPPAVTDTGAGYYPHSGRRRVHDLSWLESADWIDQTPSDCLVILIVGSVWFATYYVVQYRQWGAISLGVWIFGYDFFLKIIVMYPFAQSAENRIAVGSSLPRILPISMMHSAYRPVACVLC